MAVSTAKGLASQPSHSIATPACRASAARPIRLSPLPHARSRTCNGVGWIVRDTSSRNGQSVAEARLTTLIRLKPAKASRCSDGSNSGLSISSASRQRWESMQHSVDADHAVGERVSSLAPSGPRPVQPLARGSYGSPYMTASENGRIDLVPTAPVWECADPHTGNLRTRNLVFAFSRDVVIVVPASCQNGARDQERIGYSSWIESAFSIDLSPPPCWWLRFVYPRRYPLPSNRRSNGKLPNNTSRAAGDVDLAKSRVFTFAGATGFGHEHAVEGRLASGFVNLGATQNAGELVFNMRSFDADTPAARKYIGLKGESDDSTREQVNENMLGADVLDVAEYPTAKFEIQSATRSEGTKADSRPKFVLDGKFTLHGVTKHLRIVADTEESHGMIRLRRRSPCSNRSSALRPSPNCSARSVWRTSSPSTAMRGSTAASA